MQTSNHYYSANEGILFADGPQGERIFIGFTDWDDTYGWYEGQVIPPNNGTRYFFEGADFADPGSDEAITAVLTDAMEEWYARYKAHRT